MDPAWFRFQIGNHMKLESESGNHMKSDTDNISTAKAGPGKAATQKNLHPAQFGFHTFD